MRLALPVLVVTLFGCTDQGSTDDETTTPDTTWTTPTPEPVDTGWPAGDLANFAIVHQQNLGRTRAYAVATESSPGFINLAACAIEGSTCLTTFPDDEDEWEEIDTSRELEREIVRTRYLGYQVEFGPYVLDYREDPETGFGYYTGDVTGEGLVSGWIGPKWGGQWDSYRSNDDLYVSEPIELISPRLGEHIRFTNAELVPIEWVPNNEGYVTLTVSSRFNFERLFLLEDDGYFEFDVDDMAITDDVEDLTFELTRWNMESIRFQGHVVDLVASTSAAFTGEYANIGNRDFLYAADRCGEAGGLGALQSGAWWGRLGAYRPNLSPSTSCLGGLWTAGAQGADAIHRVEIAPKELLSVDYNVYEESASVYLLTDCSNSNTCLVGADYDELPNGHEYINYFNNTDDTRILYLVADATRSTDSVYTLDVTLNPLVPPEMRDTCAEAQSANVSPPGSYYAEFTAYTDTLNPGVGGCTGASSPGPDSMMPFEVPAATTVTVSVNMPGGDPVLYLLYNCNDAFSCPVGADASLGATEQLTYTAGATAERLYVVVDSKTGQRPYFLSISY